VSRLSVQVQSPTLQAVLECGNREQLYELSRSILCLNRREPPGPQIATVIKTHLGVDAVAMFDFIFTRLHNAGTSDKEDEELVAREPRMTLSNLEPLSSMAWRMLSRHRNFPWARIGLSFDSGAAHAPPFGKVHFMRAI
jgi:hypothetical protein